MMSKDRVRFYIKNYYFKECRDFKKVLRESLGVLDLTFHEMANVASGEKGEVEVICRPSQFARFLIHRSGVVNNNRFQELRAELFVPRQPEKPFDVSTNQAD
jgi:hypothetical protein